ncbi:MAG: 8-oxo-dGTP diphosphatase [Sphaerochaetaceae bacterium]
MLLQKIADNYLWFLVAILLGNMYQKKSLKRSYRKRTATLIIACLAMLLQILIVVILSRELPQWLFFPALAVTLLCVLPFRKKLFIFKTHCAECGTKLSFSTAFSCDDNLCDACWNKKHPDEAVKTAPAEPPVAADPSTARTVRDIDWEAWEPRETAVVCYLFSGDKVLLIHKKRGLGKGLINAPGGHVELAETASQAAIRETQEETGLTVADPEHMGVLEFQFTDGLSMRGHVFFTRTYTGDLVETDEATPFWCPISDIPYDSMWADDRIWLPMALSGKHFQGRFIFDGQTMLDHQVDEVSSTGE